MHPMSWGRVCSSQGSISSQPPTPSLPPSFPVSQFCPIKPKKPPKNDLLLHVSEYGRSLMHWTPTFIFLPYLILWDSSYFLDFMYLLLKQDVGCGTQLVCMLHLTGECRAVGLVVSILARLFSPVVYWWAGSVWLIFQSFFPKCGRVWSYELLMNVNCPRPRLLSCVYCDQQEWAMRQNPVRSLWRNKTLKRRICVFQKLQIIC